MHPCTSRRGQAAGILVTLLLIIGLVGLGAWLLMRQPTDSTLAPDAVPATAAADGAGPVPTGAAVGTPAKPQGAAPAPSEPALAAPRLEAAAPYAPKDDIVAIDISEYAGYAGLIVANGGLEPNPDSFFARHHGFQVRLTKSEGENWGKVNNGQYAATATTTDVLAVLGRGFETVVPLQIGYSRGATMLIVDRGVTSVNQLAGKVLAVSQFNESEFFARYLAREAGLKIQVLRDLDSRPAADAVGLVIYADAFIACDAYAHELAGARRLAGAVGWSPRTDEVVAASNGHAKILVSNKNLLVVADILCLNKAWALANPKRVQGLVHGILDGNRRVRAEAAPHVPVIAKALGWSEDDVRTELPKVHLANLPENLAFFAGTIDAAGSFGGIYQEAVLAYGPQLVPNPPDATRFSDTSALTALQQAGQFADERIAIAPIRGNGRSALEGDALLSKDIRFFFEPNSATLDAQQNANLGYLDTIHRYLQVSPGSVVMLRGHVDGSRREEFRREGADKLRTMERASFELSRQRAQAVRAALMARHKGLAAERIEAVGRGWDEPAGTDADQNRRVEVRWYTVE